jgi:hypothetical protein
MLPSGVARARSGLFIDRTSVQSDPVTKSLEWAIVSSACMVGCLVLAFVKLPRLQLVPSIVAVILSASWVAMASSAWTTYCRDRSRGFGD